MNKASDNLFALAVLVCLLPAVSTAENPQPPRATTGPAVTRFPVRFKQVSGVVKSMGWMQLPSRYAQGNDEPIVIEAEFSTRVELAGNAVSVVEDPQCSGGRCIEHVSELENQFLVNHDG